MESLRKVVLCACLAIVSAPGEEAVEAGSPDRNWAALHEHGYAAGTRGHYADALADFQASLPLASSPEQRAITLSDIGYTLSELDRAAEALAQLEQALKLWRSINTTGDRALQVAVTVGTLQRKLGHFADAEETLRAAADSASRNKSGSAVAQIAFGDLLNAQDRFTEAREAFEKALELWSGRDQTRASALIGLGYAQSNDGAPQPALARLREALALTEEIKAPQLEALALRNLGSTYSRIGDFSGAQHMFLRAVGIFETMPAMSLPYAGTLVSLGGVYRAENKSGLAEDVLVRALEIYDRTGGAPTIHAVALQNMALIRARQKRLSEAADLASQAYTALKSTVGVNCATIANALETRALIEQQAGDLERSERDYSSALQILYDDNLLDSNSALTIMSGYGSVLRQLHRKREAKAMEQRVKAFRAAHPPQG